MENNLIFSWAENAEGKIVHVDDVPRGLNCGCYCPHCHEMLMARHGDMRGHGFAHLSDKRRANLKICYMVILYKLAEQIIQTKKRIHVPSYYGIFSEKDIEFSSVQIDSSYEREDKQPDVIATTSDGKQYLIEFIFSYKIQHKQALDYKKLTCLEIDLSNQTLETLESFLLNSCDGRKWINNEIYFNSIVSRYARANKEVRIVEETECYNCELIQSCCSVSLTTDYFSPIIIENNGRKYRICKSEQYNHGLEKLKFRELEEEQETSQNPSDRTCFDCELNLSWANKNDGYANCGSAMSMQVPKKTPPSCAQSCKGFKRKQ